MIKRLLVIGHILSLIIFSCALVEEIKPPDEFLACLKVRMGKNDPSHASYESLNNFCIGSNRNKQTARVEGRHLNISVETVNWINELLRMSNVDMHERAKRQAVNNDTIPIPPYLQFVFPSQFGTPLYPWNRGAIDTTNQNQQPPPVQNVAQQPTANIQGQQTIVLPASVQQNPQIPAQIPQISAQGPQIPAQGLQIPSQGPQISAQGPQIPSQGLPIPAQGPQIPAQGLQIPAQGPQFPAQGPRIPAQGPQIRAQGPQIPAQRPQIPAQGRQIPAQSAQIPAQSAQIPAQVPVQQLGGQQRFQMPQFTRPPQVVRPPPRRQLRVRKEYRRLTDQERSRYHRAILMMKADTVNLI